MKKSTKYMLLALLCCLCIVSTIVLAACGEGDLEGYKPSWADTEVKEDFALDKYVYIDQETGEGVDPIKWSSNNNAIVLTENETDWTAKVTLGDERQTVELTAKVGSHKKVFTVYVAKLTASVFADSYTFKNDRKTLSKDFDLDTSCTFQGKTATISWEVANEASGHYIKVEGNKCKVTPSGMKPEVRLRATFKYGTDEVNQTYRFTVYVDLDDEALIDYWYNNTGVSQDLEGYVVAIAENDSNYANVTFYMADKSWKAGYYIFRGGADAACHAALKVGSYVRVTGTTNTNYSGLIETNQGGTVTVDADKSVTEAEVASHVYAVDNDLIGEVPSTVYHESQRVSLTGWTVKNVSAPAGSANSETLMTLTKDGKDVNVQLSGYMKGHYTLKDDNWQAIINKVKDQTGKLCTITGILGNYQGNFQVLAISADLISFTDPAPVVEEKPYVNWDPSQELTGEFYFGFGYNGTYYFAGDATNSKYNISTTTDLSKAYKFKVAKSGDGYTVQRTSDNKYLGLKKSGNNINGGYVDDAFVWKYDEGFKGFYANFDSKDRYLGNYLSSDKLRNSGDIAPSETSYINKDDEAKAKVDVSQFVARLCKDNPNYKVWAPEAGTYKLGMYQKGLYKTLYATATLDGSRITTTDDPTKAADVVVAKVAGGYTLKLGTKFIEIEAYKKDETAKNFSYKLVLVDTATGAWVWDNSLAKGMFTFLDDVEGAEAAFIGTYGTYDTMSASSTYYITGSNAGNADVSQFLARIGSIKEDTFVAARDPEIVDPDAVKVRAAVDEINELFSSKSIAKLADNKNISGHYILPGDVEFTLPAKSGEVSVSYKLVWNNSFVTLGTDGKLSIKPGDLHERINLRIDFKLGNYSTYEYVTIETYKQTDQQIVDAEMGDLVYDKAMSQGQSVTLPSEGARYPGVSIAWSVEGKTDADKAKMDGISINNDGKLVIDWVAPGDVTFILKGVVTRGDKSATYTREITVPKIVEIMGDVEIDFVSRFATFDKTNDWTSSYQAHSVPIGLDLVVDFSRADSQSSTITDRPVIAANNNTQYVTATLTGGGKDIKSVNFSLAQWNTKTFQSMYIETSKDGKTWTAVANVGFKDQGTGIDDGKFVENLTADNLDAGVIAVRLAIATKATSNTQVGLTSIKLNVRENTSVKAPVKAVYTLDTTTNEAKGTNSSYAGSGNVTVDGVTWKGEGNLTTQPWRLGGKATKSNDTVTKLEAARHITSTTSVNHDVAKVVLTLGAVGITVTKATFEVFTSDPAVAGAKASFTKDFTANVKANEVIEFAPETGTWSNCYYRLTFEVTTENTSNVYVEFSSLAFFA